MSATKIQPKLTCPHCKQKLRSKKQLRERTRCKCPKCNGNFVFATNGPNSETETYESEIPDFEILASDFDRPRLIGLKELPPPKVTKTEGLFLSSVRRLFLSAWWGFLLWP
jgi:hypothetical protein